MKKNSMSITFSAISENEAFARSVVACFCLPLNPSVAEISDVKTAVSEAVTNSVVHGYSNSSGLITIDADIDNHVLHIKISDSGVGIDDIDRALEPFFTTKPEEERSGMGFTIMKAFMDDVIVKSEKGKGTVVEMYKSIISA